jgi:ABC-2 type transport system permease protein
MISQTLNVALWEWFKLRKRWMPWLLLGVLLVFTQIIIWTSFFDYRSLEASGGQVVYGAATQGGPGPGGAEGAATVDCADLRSGNLPSALADADPAVLQGLLIQCDERTEIHEQDLRDSYADFTLPGSIANGMQAFQMFLLMMLIILIASVVGSEYSIGTLRPILSEGVGRYQFLAGKLLVLMAIAAGGLMVAVAALSLTSLGAQVLQGSAPEGFTAGSWGHSFTVVARIWSSFVPYIALTAFVGILTASTASGMAIGLGYYFAETIIVGILRSFSWFEGASAYLIGQAITEWSGSSTAGRFGAETTNASDLTVALVLLAYTVVFGVLAFAVFVRRDITGASGG